MYQKIQSKIIGNDIITYVSEISETNEIMDTTVKINTFGLNHICSISGSDIEKFHSELTAIIEKYKI